MDGAVMLCGSMFGLGARDHGRFRILRRHRLFLTSFAMLAPPDQCAGRPVGGVYGTGGGGSQTRGFKFHLGPAMEAMGMPWATKTGLSQAIPPAYTEFLGEFLYWEVAAKTGTPRRTVDGADAGCTLLSAKTTTGDRLPVSADRHQSDVCHVRATNRGAGLETAGRVHASPKLPHLAGMGPNPATESIAACALLPTAVRQGAIREAQRTIRRG